MDLLQQLQREFRAFKQSAEDRIKGLERSLRLVSPEPVFVAEEPLPAETAAIVDAGTTGTAGPETPPATLPATPPVADAAGTTQPPAEAPAEPVADAAAGAADPAADTKAKAGKGKTADQPADQTHPAKQGA